MEGEIGVAIHTAITKELEHEGLVREFIHKIQNLRKEAGLAVTDRITIAYQADPSMAAQLEAMKSYITRETLAVEFSSAEPPPANRVSFDLGGQQVAVAIARRP